MAHQYKLLECAFNEGLNDAVTRHLAEGWDLWGNPFVAEAEYFVRVKEIHYFQAVVRFDPSGHAVAEKGEILRPIRCCAKAQDDAALHEPAETLRPTAISPVIAWPEPNSLTPDPDDTQCCCLEKIGDCSFCPVHGKGQ
jgi:hypothetical protein